jgi:hypothetical protein
MTRVISPLTGEHSLKEEMMSEVIACMTDIQSGRPIDQRISIQQFISGQEGE